MKVSGREDYSTIFTSSGLRFISLVILTAPKSIGADGEIMIASIDTDPSFLAQIDLACPSRM